MCEILHSQNFEFLEMVFWMKRTLTLSRMMLQSFDEKENQTHEQSKANSFLDYHLLRRELLEKAVLEHHQPNLIHPDLKLIFQKRLCLRQQNLPSVDSYSTKKKSQSLLSIPMQKSFQN
jgi:hypothetical protein